jgi:bis(5'-adenosyl)-triphosphatase
VPHVYVHIFPRHLQGDRFAGSRPDDVYSEIERQEGVLAQDLASTSHADSGDPVPLTMDADARREPRTLEDMEQEAKWLAGFFDADE